MPNWITDAGHENGNPAWEEITTSPWDGADRLLDIAKANEGAWSMRAEAQWRGPPSVAYTKRGRFGQRFSVPDLAGRRLRYSWRLDDSKDRWEAGVRLFDGDQPVEGPNSNQLYLKQIVTVDGVEPEGVYNAEASALITPAGTDLTLVVYLTERFTELIPPAPVTSFAIFNFDSWSYMTDEEFAMAVKRRDIRDGAVTELEKMTTANGHAVELVAVGTEYQRRDKIVGMPAAQVLYGDEEREHAEMHRKKGFLELHVVFWAQDTSALSAESQLDEMVASGETLLETQTGAQWLGLGYIDQVTIDGIRPFEAEEDATRGFRSYVMDVTVVYRYDRLDP